MIQGFCISIHNQRLKNYKNQINPISVRAPVDSSCFKRLKSIRWFKLLIVSQIRRVWCKVSLLSCLRSLSGRVLQVHCIPSRLQPPFSGPTPRVSPTSRQPPLGFPRTPPPPLQNKRKQLECVLQRLVSHKTPTTKSLLSRQFFSKARMKTQRLCFAGVVWNTLFRTAVLFVRRPLYAERSASVAGKERFKSASRVQAARCTSMARRTEPYRDFLCEVRVLDEGNPQCLGLRWIPSPRIELPSPACVCVKEREGEDEQRQEVRDADAHNTAQRRVHELLSWSWHPLIWNCNFYLRCNNLFWWT